MTLTQQGQLLYSHAKELIKKEIEIKNIMLSADPYESELRISCLDTFIRLYLSRVIPGFVKKYPKAKLRIETGYNQYLYESLDKDNTDLIGVAGDNIDAKYKIYFSKKEKLVLLAKNKEDLKSLPILVLSDDCFFGQSLSRQFQYTRKKLKISSIESILECVSSGLGISFFPESLIKDHKKSKNIQLINTSEYLRYSLIKKGDHPLSTIEETFISMVKKA